MKPPLKCLSNFVQRGAVSLIDFLDAERSFRPTQLAYRQALASYLLALERLREAVGTRALPRCQRSCRLKANR
jgi:cobalt-zinc-cadmium efflux system outer membrane protein